jgi:D-glycero-alpha-D-manno-heptose-7-phosphate kinase
MIVRSKSPLRLGLAGGGTDISAYSDLYGGAVLNATIDMFSYCTIETIDENNSLKFISLDLDKKITLDSLSFIELNGDLILHKAIYNRVVQDFNNGKSLSICVTTYSDAPPGSGLGSSSTMIVTMLAAYRKLLGFRLNKHDLAHLAYKIERHDCNMSGGKQDQYAATFGGFNFIEFFNNDKVVVDSLKIRSSVVNELEYRTMLFFTGISRDSSKIINEQIQAVRSSKESSSLQSMHKVKELSFKTKETLLREDVDSLIDNFSKSWLEKKKMSSSITNKYIDDLTEILFCNGVEALKISGAGGGGFMLLFIDPAKRYEIISLLKPYDGYVQSFHFYEKGVEAWIV